MKVDGLSEPDRLLVGFWCESCGRAPRTEVASQNLEFRAGWTLNEVQTAARHTRVPNRNICAPWRTPTGGGGEAAIRQAHSRPKLKNVRAAAHTWRDEPEVMRAAAHRGATRGCPSTALTAASLKEPGAPPEPIGIHLS